MMNRKQILKRIKDERMRDAKEEDQ